MDPVEIQTLAALEATHWWYVARRRILLRWAGTLQPNAWVLDVGSAAGGNTAALLAAGFRTASLEFSDIGVQLQRAKGLEVTQGDARDLPWPTDSFDAVICLDVLEHIVEDSLVAQEIRRVLRPGGRFLVAVPEDARLWSAHDVAVHHVRRYSRDELVRTLSDAGLQVERAWSSNVLVKPLVRLLRKRSTGSDLRTTPQWQQRVLLALGEAERLCSLTRYSGVTVWAAGRVD